MTAFKRLRIAGLLIAAVLVTHRGYAQDPSADSIIKSLRPGAGLLGGTRGIRPVKPSATNDAPAATPAAPTAAAPVARAAASAPRPAKIPAAVPQPDAATNEAPSVNLTVQFATNSADLTPAAIKTLTQLGRALSSATLSTYKFRIEGHTDTAGSPDMNKTLSTRRAQTVVDFLANTFKIDPARLEPVGMGEDGLLVQTPANTPEPRNRRVQVINLGA